MASSLALSITANAYLRSEKTLRSTCADTLMLFGENYGRSPFVISTLTHTVEAYTTHLGEVCLRYQALFGVPRARIQTSGMGHLSPVSIR